MALRNNDKKHMNAGSSLGLESAPTGFIRDLGCINVFGGRWTLHRGAQLCPDDNIDAQQKPGVMAWYNMNSVSLLKTDDVTGVPN
jgi:hypothetical protein